MNPGDGLRVKQATMGMGAKPKQFPSDILFDIFSRLPIKTLLRFKCVSPLWCTIIDDPYLARLHRLQLRIEEPKVLVLEPMRKPAVPVFREDKSGILRFVNRKFNAYSLESCCNGLLCFTRIFLNCNHSPLFLVNLQRQQVVELPRPPCIGGPVLHTSDDSDCRCSYGLGFDCATNTFKIVVVFFNGGNPAGEDGHLCAQVYTLGGRGRGSSSLWRPVKGPPNCSFYERPEWERGFYEMPVYARGALHWLVKPQGYNIPWLFRPQLHDDVALRRLQWDLINIAYFDVGKEEFGLISPPRTGMPFHLVDLGGDLAVVTIAFHFWLIEIWIMNQKKEWVQEHQISLCMVSSNLRCVRVMGLFEDGEILVRVNWKSFLFYNPKNHALKRRRHYIPRVLSIEREVLCHNNKGTLLSLDMFREEGTTILSLDDIFQEEY